jgi:hypothetical protein
MMVELTGYLASVLVAISITIKGGLYFRILNLTGSLCFMIYGLLIKSWPVAIINVYAMGVNIFYIVKELRGRQNMHI